MSLIPPLHLMKPKRPSKPHRLDRERPRHLETRQVRPGPLLQLVVKPLVLEFQTRRCGVTCDVTIPRCLHLGFPVVRREDVEHHLAIAQGETAVEAFAVAVAGVAGGGDGRADEVVLEEVVDFGGGVRADYAVGLEDQHVRCGRELFPYPGRSEEFRDGLLVCECDVVGELSYFDAAVVDSALEGGGVGRVGGAGVEDDGPGGTENGGEVKEEGSEGWEGTIFDYNGYVVGGDSFC
ncbi:hypothetical protein GLAREA_11720 [Glarea lozoyensis ATCC 20868]|uniref:Uncharacterized protein n=1 Tax=Glarea lozoyensis (strain ATCC 20868 / MF5171) TaxID=1116229 RepID=S3CIQ9_GLAL2|nr:uncharacterized protein GLAREA_11720 [Glarea lozoyensis ATCC 20868]EPE25139.1 hypothetical protein GLAREA_11720 [Glarea lozoyensis ATCC 20868]